MTFALFEDGGKFLAGRIMSQTDASAQVELDSGRRVKVKAGNIVLQFEQPIPAELQAQAQAMAPEIDLDLAWEFAPEGEFGFAEFAKDYYDSNASTVQLVAVLLRLFEAPHYFRRVGKGRFKKAPQETVKAALLGIERKRQQQLQIDEWAQALERGECPESVREQLYRILFRPDKNALEYKAVVQASRKTQVSPLDLFKRSGAIVSDYQFHWQRFLYEFFPKGVQFPAALPSIDGKALAQLPLAEVEAFSIDDSQTTEIDDALSVTGLESGQVTVGIHIAAPGLGIGMGDALDHVARARLSTVYMPGWKITMLPDALVQQFTLREGEDCPAVSLYVTYDEQTLEMVKSVTQVERVRVAKNLRYDQLEDTITEATLTGAEPAHYEHALELAFLFRLAQHLKAQREIVRGKPETFHNPDYSFKLVDDGGNPTTVEPAGDEQVRIGERKRGSPLDLMVAELMIVANTTWGGWLASLGVPGIYRSQHSLAPGVKVRMGSKPLPHAGIGVPQYAWSTSPLRRYVDLVNQWQIIACAKHGTTAALAAPFKPKDAELFSVISAFEAAYGGYNAFQRGIERYWTLRYLQQQGITTLEASVMKDGLVRASHLPLVFMAVGAQNHARGTLVLVKITSVDTLRLDVNAQVEQVLQPMQSPSGTAQAPLSEDDGDDGQDTAGPIALAVDVNAEDEGAPQGDGAS